MDIQSLLQEHHITYKGVGQHEHARPGWIQIECPWCSPRSGRFRLGINLAKGYSSCWNCGGHRLSDVLSAITGLSSGECYKLLRGIGWERRSSEEDKKRSSKLVLPSGIGPMLGAHRRYLDKRGFDPDYIEKLWGVQGIGIEVNLKWSLFIPIHFRGEVVSWTTRSIGTGETRYISAGIDQEAIPAKHLLYGEDHCRHCIIVVEGPTDVWAIGPGAVAILGLNFSQEQLAKMIEYPMRVICFDNESQAQRRAHRLARQLFPYTGQTYVVRLETGKDAAEADPKEIRELRKRFLG